VDADRYPGETDDETVARLDRIIRSLVTH